MSIAGSFGANVSINETVATGLASSTSAVSRNAKWSIANGTAVGQGDKTFSAEITMPNATPVPLDLKVLAGAFGSVALAKLKAIMVEAMANAALTVTVRSHATTGVPLFLALGDGIILGAGQVFMWFDPSGAGKTVTAATGNVLEFVNSGATPAKARVYIVGTSA